MPEPVVINGKKFITSKEAASLTGYARDYIGQLVRMGKVEGKVVEKVLFVNEESLIAHKDLKNSNSKVVENSFKAAVAEKLASAMNIKNVASLAYNTTDTNSSFLPKLSKVSIQKVNKTTAKKAEPKLVSKYAQTSSVKQTVARVAPYADAIGKVGSYALKHAIGFTILFAVLTTSYASIQTPDLFMKKLSGVISRASVQENETEETYNQAANIFTPFNQFAQKINQDVNEFLGIGGGATTIVQLAPRVQTATTTIIREIVRDIGTTTIVRYNNPVPSQIVSTDTSLRADFEMYKQFQQMQLEGIFDSISRNRGSGGSSNTTIVNNNASGTTTLTNLTVENTSTSTIPNLDVTSFLTLNGDMISDFVGSGLELSNGVLSATAGSGFSTTSANYHFDTRLAATTTLNNLTTLRGLTDLVATNATVTTIAIGSDYITDLTGTGLSVVNGALTVSGASGFSTTSADYWETLQSRWSTTSDSYAFDTRLAATSTLNNLNTLGGLSSIGSSTGTTTINGVTVANGKTLLQNEVRISNQSTPLTGSIYFGSTNDNYLNFDGSNFMFNGAGALFTSSSAIVSQQNNSSLGLGARYNASLGTTYFGATNSATPDAVISNTNGSEVLRVTHSGQAIGGYFTATSTTATSTFPLLSTNALSVNGTYITSVWGTTSANYWESTQNRWSTTSAAYFLSVNQGSAWSTTSADYWEGTKSRWATTSDSYAFDTRLAATTTLNNITTLRGLTDLITTNATTTSLSINGDYITDLTGDGLSVVNGSLSVTGGAGFSTTAADYWETQQNPRWATTADSYAFDTRLAATTTLNNLTKIGTQSTFMFGNATGTSLYVTSLNCTLNSNGGKVTTDSSGQLVCANDQTGAGGGGGSDVNWTFFNNSGVSVSTTSNQVIIGASATSSLQKLEVAGGVYITGNLGIGTTSPYAKLSVTGQIVGEYFTATSTTATSTFPLLSVNALSINGTYVNSLWGTTSDSYAFDTRLAATSTLNNLTNLRNVTLVTSTTTNATTTNFFTTTASATQMYSQNGLSIGTTTAPSQSIRISKTDGTDFFYADRTTSTFRMNFGSGIANFYGTNGFFNFSDNFNDGQSKFTQFTTNHQNFSSGQVCLLQQSSTFGANAIVIGGGSGSCKANEQFYIYGSGGTGSSTATGVQQFAIGSTGNVLIGTGAVPAAVRLTVQGGATIQDSVTSSIFTATSTTATSTFPLLSTNALSVNGTYITSVWGTTSANYWESTQNRWSTTSAAYFLSVNQGSAWSTTSADYWDGTKSRWATTSDSYAFDTRLAATTTLNNITTLGSLSLPLTQTTGTLPVNRGGTGQTSFAQGWLSSDGATITSSTSPTVAYITATSTTATSTFPLLSVNAITINGAYVNSVWGTTSSNYWESIQTRWATTSDIYAFDTRLAATTTLNNITTLGSLSLPFTQTTGTVSVDRGGTGITSPSAAGVLLGNYAGTGYMQIATSSLGLLTTDVAEGSNLYWTNGRFDTRFDSRLTATTSLPYLGTLAGLSSIGSSTGTTTIQGGLNVAGGCLAVNGACLPSPLVGGTGSANRVAIWNGSQTLSYEDSFVWDDANNRLVAPTFNATNSASILELSSTTIVRADNALNSFFAGQNAGNSTASGDSNVGVGSEALDALTTGTANTALGRSALSAINSGGYNIGIGYNAMSVLETGSSNIAVGASSLSNFNSGDDNTVLGAGAGSTLTSGSRNILIGSLADVSTDGLSNAIAIGYNARVDSSNSLILGNGVNVGIGTSSPYAKLSVTGQTVAEYFTATSTTATSTFPNLALTNLLFASDYVTDLTGSGLSIVDGALTVSGTSGFSTTSADYHFINRLSSTSTLPNLNILTGLATVGSTTGTTSFFGSMFFNNRVGIGTTTLTEDFQVQDTVRVGNELNIVEVGSATDPGFYFSTDTNTGLFAPAADTFAFTTGGTERARFDSNGNFGIGTTSPAAKLAITQTGTEPAFVVEDSALDDTPFIIDASGNVGIGTSSPSARFEIGGSATGNRVRFLTASSSNRTLDFDRGLVVGAWSIQSSITNNGSAANIILAPSGGSIGIATTGSSLPASLSVGGSVFIGANATVYGNLTASSTRTQYTGNTNILNYYSYGDSITEGSNASSVNQYYNRIIARTLGYTLNNMGVSGTVLEEDGQIDNIYAQVVSSTTVASILTGYNNHRYYGESVNKVNRLDTFKQALPAALAYLAIPDRNKVFGYNMSTTGSWTATSTYATTTGISTRSAGATASTILYGNTIYVVGTRGFTSDTGSVTITVDGVNRGTYSCAGVMSSYTDGRKYAPFMMRVGNLHNGAHTVTVTSNNTGYCEINWAAGNANNVSNGAPAVYVGTTLRMTDSQYDTNSPNGSINANREINQVMEGVIKTLASDGLNVIQVDTEAAFDPTTMMSFDRVHPDAWGHAVIAEAFLNKMNGLNYGNDKSFARFFSGYVPKFTIGAGTSTTFTFDGETGRFGIASSSPLYPLSVEGNAGITGQLFGSTSATASAPAFSFINATTTGIFRATTGALAISVTGTPNLVVGSTTVGIGTTSPFAELSIDTTSNTTGVTAFFVGSTTKTDFMIHGVNGNIGIGTSTLSRARLSISNPGITQPAVMIDGGNAGIDLIRMFRSGVNGGSGQGMNLRVSGNNPYFCFNTGMSETTSGTTRNCSMYSQSLDSFMISTTTSSGVVTGQEPFVIRNSDGYVGLGGTTTPWGAVSINPSFQTSGSPSFVVGSSTKTDFMISQAGRIFAPRLLASSGTPNSLCMNATTKEITENAASTCTVSDRDQKQNIQDLTVSGLDALKAIKSVSFAYNDRPDRSRIGFIAQDLQAIDNRLGDAFDEQGIARSIDIPAIMSITVKAVQELDVKVDSNDLYFKQFASTTELALEEQKTKPLSLSFGNGFRFAIEPASSTTKYLQVVSNNNAEVITFDEAGNVGIGTTTPAYKLQVAGDIAATAFVNVSTRASKKDIKYISETEKMDILEKLGTVKIARYRYNDESNENPLRLGLIAEEAPAEVLSASGKGVDVYKLATFTLSAVQAQQKRITDIEIRLAALETRFASTTVSTSTPTSSDIIASVIEGMRNIFADSLTIGSPEKPNGITLYDEKTGEPYCIKVVNGDMKSIAGKCTAVRLEKPTEVIDTPSETATSTATTTPAKPEVKEDPKPAASSTPAVEEKPKENAPKAEEPKVETPAPGVEEKPKEETKPAEAPKAEEPKKDEAPKVETPEKNEAPKVEATKVEESKPAESAPSVDTN